jgi:molybdopterin synthase sulfur carrier subunit
MIKIRLKCFSQVKYALGKNEITFELENGTSTDDLKKMVRKKAEGKLNDVTLSTALNKKYISKNTELEDGDEVAFIPPVQGG